MLFSCHVCGIACEIILSRLLHTYFAQYQTFTSQACVASQSRVCDLYKYQLYRVMPMFCRTRPTFWRASIPLAALLPARIAATAALPATGLHTSAAVFLLTGTVPPEAKEQARVKYGLRFRRVARNTMHLQLHNELYPTRFFQRALT
jgi:hypothetical protein